MRQISIKAATGVFIIAMMTALAVGLVSVQADSCCTKAGGGKDTRCYPC